jgi:hypothetical protein
MTRMRTLTETINHIKQTDPETAVTANALRRMVICGQVPHIKAGKKYLIDLDTLFEYLKGAPPEGLLPENRNSGFKDLFSPDRNNHTIGIF